MTSNVLRLVFKSNDTDKKVVYNFTYAKAAPDQNDVKALGTVIIANNDIFAGNKPDELLGAEVIVTTSTPINVTP